MLQVPKVANYANSINITYFAIKIQIDELINNIMTVLLLDVFFYDFEVSFVTFSGNKCHYCLLFEQRSSPII